VESFTHPGGSLIAPLVDCGIGIFLLTGRKGMSRIWLQLRGRTPSPEDE
jgi:hypothetical protein